MMKIIEIHFFSFFCYARSNKQFRSKLEGSTYNHFCTCKTGYYGDGFTCEPIDPCEVNYSYFNPQVLFYAILRLIIATKMLIASLIRLFKLKLTITVDVNRVTVEMDLSVMKLSIPVPEYLVAQMQAKKSSKLVIR